jgi:hypothetical protein
VHPQCTRPIRRCAACRGNIRPQNSCRSQLRDFDVEVHTDAEEEAHPLTDVIGLHPATCEGRYVLARIRHGQRKFEHRVRTRFLKVISRHRECIESRHVFAEILDNVGGDAQ